jgi:hypothetical protein
LAPVRGNVINTSPVRTEAEIEKRLFATARAQERFLVLDNMEVPINTALSKCLRGGRLRHGDSIPRPTSTV